MKLIKLDKDYNIKLKSQVVNFLDTDYIYIPIENRSLPFHKNQEIKKEEMLFLNVYSPISGNIIGITDCKLASGNTGKCLVIANNYQEKQIKRNASRKKINAISAPELINKIFNEHLKEVLATKEVSHIIISGIDDEPYFGNESFIQKENTKELLEMIDALQSFYPACKAHIVIKNIDSENITNYTNFMGTYQNIELNLVDDLYLIGKEENLLKKLHIKDHYIYLKASEVYEIYYNIKKQSPLLEKYITISGDGIDTPQIFNVKIGTKVLDLIKTYFDINLEDYDIYVNGLMQGIKMNIESLIVTPNLAGIMIMKKSANKPQKCIKCGKCIEVCPIHSNPLQAYLKKEKVPCINCGLCTYICPAYINLRKYLTGDENE